MVPIKNENGVVIGFGGRVLDGIDNSEDIELYGESNGIDGIMSGSPQSLANLAAQSSSTGRGRFTQPLVQTRPYPFTTSSSSSTSSPLPSTSFSSSSSATGVSSQAKYLNSPESVVFKKGSTLFGLDLAKKHIIRCVFFILSSLFFILYSLCAMPSLNSLFIH